MRRGPCEVTGIKIWEPIRRVAHPVLVAVSASAVLALVLLRGAASAVEEPPHRVDEHDGNFEIRDYPPLAVAEATIQGDRNSAAYAGYRKLAGFIFGANSRKQSIEMTAPVIEARAERGMTTSALAEPAASSSSWVIRFVTPRGFSLVALPKPDDLSIRLREEPPARFAVLRFSGLAGEETPPSRRRLASLGQYENLAISPCWTADHWAIQFAVDAVVYASQRGDDSDQDVNLG